eukprot:Ihof_evm1s771 gene=Ihof_evmTU1s771
MRNIHLLWFIWVFALLMIVAADNGEMKEEGSLVENIESITLTQANDLCIEAGTCQCILTGSCEPCNNMTEDSPACKRTGYKQSIQCPRVDDSTNLPVAMSCTPETVATGRSLLVFE